MHFVSDLIATAANRRAVAVRTAILALLTCTACGQTSNGGAGGASSAAGNGSHAPGGASSGGSGASGGVEDVPKPSVDLSASIVVDQFGYRSADQKIAVIRDPQSGYDSAQAFSPDTSYALIDANTGAQTFTAAPAPWRSGATDVSSGDKAWWFDFSSVNTPGHYYVFDAKNKARSAVFRIGDDVYRDVLKHALRMLFYQRAGFAKDAKYAGDAWADGASHLGPLQDKNCRRYNAKGDATTERDLHGGWYDAGDLNSYTSWTAAYLVGLLHAYAETPSAFSDDYGIPESGNGIPDIIDETKWGMDWLVRMQQSDGSVLSVLGRASATPPSAAKGQSLYGTASTSSTISSAAAYAYGSIVLRKIDSLSSYADDLLARAKRAWDWATANPSVLFYNNDGSHGTAGLASGQQEMDDYNRLARHLSAAVYLYQATGDTQYKTYFEQNYTQLHVMQWGTTIPFEADMSDILLDYADLSSATPSISSSIKTKHRAAIAGGDNLAAYRSNVDPYRAYLKDYVWGSNSTKASEGNLLYDIVVHALDSSLDADSERAAQGYVHYIHGVNPFGLVYLTNMSVAHAEKSATQLWHTWFADGSEWDSTATSKYGPAPGFLPGGPNPGYDWDGCCPSSCGGGNNQICTSTPVSPPKGQPAQKAYKDFNTGWPLNAWEISEPDDGYQVAYIRLLSKFVR